jgi:acyl-CoA synthetase (AMP-forming)/AMP-acid ligase II/acyl carrier protein
MRQLPRTSVVPRSGEPATFVEVVRERAQQAPDAETFTFLETGEMAGSRQVLCNAALERRARAIGARLQSLGLAGERALLVYAPGLHYVEGFLGCLFGGVIAVPVYPPDPRRLARTLPRLQAVVRDARAAAVLTTSDLAAVGDASTSIAPDLASLRWVHSDLVDPGEADAWRAPSIGPDSLAFLQYTSGSTAEPRGVMLTHQNLLHNSRLIRARFAVREGSRAVIWLPPYHDMGLIGGILQPLVSGVRVVLMSPLAMLERPMRWLEAMAETRAAISGGPNFGYELCVRKSTPEERARLDLRSWRVAFNGADVVRPETIERFARAFEVAGFQRRAFLPCYGLAEATLLVTAGEVGAGPRTASAPDGRLVAGCGRVVGDQQVLILDPGRDQPLPAGEIGEICVRGPSVAAGYWNCPEDTARTFARSGGSLLLRTGDLGFLSVHGELYVRGRRKDLLILRGRNHYPQDIEFTVERSHPALRKGGGAAFSVEVDGQERLVVVHEIDPRRPAEPEAVAEAIRRDIGQDHDIPVHTIALVRPSSVPKTSSGKVRRRASKAAFLAGELEVVASRSFAAEDAEPAAPVSVARLRALEPQERRRALTAWIRQEVATQLGVTAAELDETTPVRMLGLDSIAAMEVAHALETHAGIRLPITNLLGDLAIVDVARKAADAFDETASTDDRPHTREGLAPSAGEVALSEGQAALWFLHALAPGSSAYHVPCALHLRSELDVDALRRAFDLLHERHALLRSSVVPLEGVPRLRVEEHGRASFSVVDVGGLSDAELASRVDAAARRPFDLRRGPLLRVWLFRRAADDAVLLLVAHHLVVDLWSMVVLLRELGIAYGALRRGAEVALPSPAASYADFVRWQRELLAGPAAERALAHFRVALTRAPATLNLPTDAPRPPVQGFRGNAVRFALDRGLIDRLRALARGNGATLYAVLLAAWGAVLARHAGQDRVVVGVPTNGRPGAAFEDVVGYFVNPLPVCVDLSGDPRFADELVGRVREALVAMLEHQHHPFSRLVEALQSGRDASRSPIFQTMLVLERPQARGIDREAVSHFVLGGPGPRAQFGGLPADPYPVKTSGSQLDVSLTLVETEDGLVAALDYDTDLFDASTAEGLAKRFGVFLRAAVERPTAALSELAVLDAAERRLLLEAWSGAGGAARGAGGDRAAGGPHARRPRREPSGSPAHLPGP